MNETKTSIKNPFKAKILKVSKLNKEGSSKCNHFAEFSLEGSNIKYDVGCSFGLLPDNNEEDVLKILSILNASKDTKITPKKVGHEITLYEFLSHRANLSRVTKKIANALIPHQKDTKLADLLEGEWKEYTENHDLTEFLVEFYQEKLSVNELVDLISPMLARFYSVASSQNVMGDTLQLFIADFCYNKGNKKCRSLTSSHITSKKTIRLFHQQNPSFTPQKDDSPVIMIGPGTGIAAFLGFIQERILHRKCKNNILFTGDRNKATDFYFEETLTQYEKDGNLKLFTAFSRDSDQKVYVQDRIWEQRALLFDLIEKQNAQIFVSGDAHYMAKDVVATFEKIFEEAKGITHEEAHHLVNQLKKEKRFHLDVY